MHMMALRALISQSRLHFETYHVDIDAPQLNFKANKSSRVLDNIPISYHCTKGGI